MKVIVEENITKYIIENRKDVLEAVKDLKKGNSSQILEKGKELAGKRGMMRISKRFGSGGGWAWFSFSDRTLRYLRYWVRQGKIKTKKIKGSKRFTFEYIG